MPRMRVDLRPSSIQFVDGQDPIANGIAQFGDTMAKLPVQLAEIRMKESARDEDKRRFDEMQKLKMDTFAYEKGKQHWTPVVPTEGNPDQIPSLLDVNSGTMRPMTPGAEPQPKQGTPGDTGIKTAAAPAPQGLLSNIGQFGARAAASTVGAVGAVPLAARQLVENAEVIPIAQGAGYAAEYLNNMSRGGLARDLTMKGINVAGRANLFTTAGLAAPGIFDDVQNTLRGQPITDKAMAGNLPGEIGRAIGNYSAGAQPQSDGRLDTPTAIKTIDRIAYRGRAGDSHWLREAIGGTAGMTMTGAGWGSGVEGIKTAQINADHEDLGRSIRALPISPEDKKGWEDELRRVTEIQQKDPDGTTMATFSQALQKYLELYHLRPMNTATLEDPRHQGSESDFYDAQGGSAGDYYQDRYGIPNMSQGH